MPTSSEGISWKLVEDAPGVARPLKPLRVGGGCGLPTPAPCCFGAWYCRFCSRPKPVEHIVDRESRIMTEAAPGSQDPPSPSLKTMTVIKPHGIHPFGETQSLRKMRIQAVCYFFWIGFWSEIDFLCELFFIVFVRISIGMVAKLSSQLYPKQITTYSTNSRSPKGSMS